MSCSAGRKPRLTPPFLCLNILNGGWHAYTNPVLSDFHEYILVAKSTDLEDVIGDHNDIQRTVKERLLGQTKTVVSGNPVNRFATADNRECIDFLLKVRDGLGLANKFDLMIDASGGDLWTDEGIPSADHRRLHPVAGAIPRVLDGHHPPIRPPRPRGSLPRTGPGELAAADHVPKRLQDHRRQLLFL